MPEFVADIELSVPRIEESPLVVPIPVLSAEEDEEEELPASIEPVEDEAESVVDSVVVELLSPHEPKAKAIAEMMMKRFIMFNFFDSLQDFNLFATFCLPGKYALNSQ